MSECLPVLRQCLPAVSTQLTARAACNPQKAKEQSFARCHIQICKQLQPWTQLACTLHSVTCDGTAQTAQCSSAQQKLTRHVQPLVCVQTCHKLDCCTWVHKCIPVDVCGARPACLTVSPPHTMHAIEYLLLAVCISDQEHCVFALAAELR